MMSVREKGQKSDWAAQALQPLVSSTKDDNGAGEWDPSYSVLGQYALEGRLEQEACNRKLQELEAQHELDLLTFSGSGSVERRRRELVISFLKIIPCITCISFRRQDVMPMMSRGQNLSVQVRV